MKKRRLQCLIVRYRVIKGLLYSIENYNVKKMVYILTFHIRGKLYKLLERAYTRYVHVRYTR